MSILLIGNKGKLFDACLQKLSLFYIVDSFSIVKNAHCNLPLALNNYKNSVDFKKYEVIIYISGETRDPDYMHLLNFRFPSELIDEACSHNISFIYLSSLSIYGGCFDDLITCNSQVAPIDTYGFTKSLLDLYVAKLKINDKNLKIKTILPASIYPSRGRSPIEKFEFLKERYSCFFKFLSFQGCLSYIDQNKLVNFIVASVSSRDYRSQILSSHYDLVKFKSVFIFPKPPIIFFKIVYQISPKVSLRLRIFLRGIRYE
jgi:hypothetical protein